MSWAIVCWNSVICLSVVSHSSTAYFNYHFQIQQITEHVSEEKLVLCSCIILYGAGDITQYYWYFSNNQIMEYLQALMCCCKDIVQMWHQAEKSKQSSQRVEMQWWAAKKGSLQWMWGKRFRLWMCLRFQQKAIVPDCVYTVTDLLSSALSL